jgi:hypothetical protein
LKKLTVFEQIYCQILRAYGYIGPKNLGIKRPKRSILASEWGFERCLLLTSRFGFRPEEIERNLTGDEGIFFEGNRKRAIFKNKRSSDTDKVPEDQGDEPETQLINLI